MIDVKYVIIDHCKPIIFFTHSHCDIELHGKVTSAGFMRIIYDGDTLAPLIETYGSSNSLKGMGPEAADRQLLEIFLGLK